MQLGTWTLSSALSVGPANYCPPSMDHVTLELLCSKIRVQLPPAKVGSCTADVPHWPPFAAWWASRRCLVGPQEEATDILWVCADATTGLHKIPVVWAKFFVPEAARFLHPANTSHSLTMTVHQSRFLKCKTHSSWRISSTSGLT